MSFGSMFLISIGSAIIVSLFQDGSKMLFNHIAFKSDCKCCKLKYNEYKSSGEIIKNKEELKNINE